MTTDTEHKIIHEKKIVIDSRSRPKRENETETDEPSGEPGTVAELVPVDNRPVLLFVITQGMWEEPQKYIVQLARHFASDYQLHLIFGTYEFTGKNTFRQEFESLGGTVHTINALTHKNVLANEVNVIFNLWKLLSAIKPDVVHTNDGKTSLLTGLARMMAGSSHQVATMHGLLDTSDAKSYEASIANWFVKVSYGMAKTIMTRDQHTHQQAVKMFGDRAVLVLPGIHEIHFLNAEEKMRSIIQDAPDRIAGSMKEAGTLILGNIAPLEADQGIAYLLQALQQLQEQGQQFVYIHYGDGDQKHLLEYEIEQFGLSDRVLMKGLDTLASLYLPVFDVVVHPTLRPGSLDLLRDAGLAGRAVIITDVEGVSDAIQDGTHAVVIPQKDPTAIAEAISFLSRDKARRDTMGRALEQRIRKNYSEEAMFNKTREIYEGR